MNRVPSDCLTYLGNCHLQNTSGVIVGAGHFLRKDDFSGNVIKFPTFNIQSFTLTLQQKHEKKYQMYTVVINRPWLASPPFFPASPEATQAHKETIY